MGRMGRSRPRMALLMIAAVAMAAVVAGVLARPGEAPVRPKVTRTAPAPAAVVAPSAPDAAPRRTRPRPRPPAGTGVEATLRRAMLRGAVGTGEGRGWLPGGPAPPEGLGRAHGGPPAARGPRP